MPTPVTGCGAWLGLRSSARISQAVGLDAPINIFGARNDEDGAGAQPVGAAAIAGVGRIDGRRDRNAGNGQGSSGAIQSMKWRYGTNDHCAKRAT